MKKVLTLFFALFAMTFFANAQYLLQEGFESGAIPTGWTTIDADNDGYTWEGSANPVSYFSSGTDLSGTGHNSSNGFVLSGSYTNVTSTALNPNNWLITPAINLTSNSTLTFWVCAQDASYAAEHYGVYISTTGTSISNFTELYQETIDANGGPRVQGLWKQKTVNLASYTGQQVYIAFRHFNCSDEFVLNLDDVEIFQQPTSPTITVNTTAIDFGIVAIPGEGTATANITAYNLTAGITATTAAPFTVSADGTNYGTTATIAQAGGTLYVKYTPTAAGTHNGTVTLASTGATSVTISLTGEGMDCSNTPLPYTFDFLDQTLANCWSIVDANNDGNAIFFNFTYGYALYAADQTSTANDWLISPAFQIPSTGAAASYEYCMGYEPAKYSVYAIPAGQTYATATQILATQTINNNTFQTNYLDLSAFAGQTIQIAFKVESDPSEDGLIGFRNFFIGNDIPSTFITSVESIDFGTIPCGTVLSSRVIIKTVNVNEIINVTTSAPYGLSIDGTNFSTSLTIPANPAMEVYDTVYVQFAPIAAGTYDDIVEITTTTLSDTITLTGSGISCNVITSFPFTEDFEDNSTTRACWTINDANGDGRTFSFYNGAARCQYHSTNYADDWLISPEITLTGSQIATFDYWAYSSTWSPEKFQVFAINGTVSTPLTGQISVSNTTAESQIVDLSSLNGTYRIGIHCISDPNMFYLYIDNFVINDVSTESITVDPTSLTFSTMAGSTSNSQVATVTGYGLTSNISVTASANFEVSADNTTFGASANIPVSGAVVQSNLYVRYHPTVAGTHTGTITVTSGTATTTIAVTGNAVDCSNPFTLPFTEDFEAALSDCWLTIDADGDGQSWYSTLGSTLEAHGGDGTYASASWTSSAGPLTPNNWLITPAISIPSTGAMLSWWVAAQDPSYPSDHYQVMVSTTGTATTDFTSVYEETIASGDWAERTVALPAYANQTIHIAFVHNNCTDWFVMKIDDISVTALSSDPTITVDPTAVNFGHVITPNTAEASVNVNAYNLSANVTISTTAPFAVSTDGITYNTSATMTQPGGVLHIQYAPTSAGTHNGTVNLTSGTVSATITLTGMATEPLDCNVPASLPFFEGFEGEDVPDCWSLIDADGDGNNWYVLNNSQSSSGGFVVHSGEGHITSASYAGGALTPDNWLITPQIAMGTNGHLSFWAAGQDPSWASEVFSVYLSTTGTSTSDFNVTLLDHQTATETMTEYTADLSAYAGQNVYIAFRHHDISDMFRLNLDDVSITGENSIDEVENNYVSVFPNPANHVINVNASSNISNVEIYTISGQKVGDFTANGTSTAISTSNLSNGLYLMKINTENGTINKKFSVVR